MMRTDLGLRNREQGVKVKQLLVKPGHAGAAPGDCTPADGGVRRGTGHWGLEPLSPMDVIVKWKQRTYFHHFTF